MTPVRRLDNDHQVYGVMGNLRPHQITFDPSDPACLSRDEAGALTFRFLAPGNTAEALLVLRHTDETVDGYEMRLVGAAGELSFWELTIEPPEPTLRYSLAVRLDDDTPIYLGVTGITGAIERIDRFEVETAAVAVHQVPDWVRGAVIYQIFPDRFANGDRANDPADVQPWGSPPTRAGFMGGDLDGIADHLDHLEELGVDLIYLNPVFTSPSNHRYDTRDYYEVDAALGGNEAMHRLVKAAHERSIRVMLDTSLNHLHPSFSAFQDVIEKGVDSQYADWFIVHEHPPAIRYRPELVAQHEFWSQRLPQLEATTNIRLVPSETGPLVEPTYDAWYGVPEMPRVDLQNPEARQYMIDVATHWITEYGIDGWRMDVVRYIDHDFWADVRAAVHAANPETYLLAEVMGDARRWLRGDEFDATMNYTFREICIDFFAHQATTGAEFVADYLRTLAMYSPAVTDASHNLLDSHDTARFLHHADEDQHRLVLATVFQLTTPGAPGLYYGNELPLTGGEDPDCRRAFDWERVDSEHHQAVRAVAQLRRDRFALRRGNITMLPVVDNCVAFRRALGDEELIVAINNGPQAAHLKTITAPRAKVLWSTGEVEIAADGATIGAHAAAIGELV